MVVNIPHTSLEVKSGELFYYLVRMITAYLILEISDMGSVELPKCLIIQSKESSQYQSPSPLSKNELKVKSKREYLQLEKYGHKRKRAG